MAREDSRDDEGFNMIAPWSSDLARQLKPLVIEAYGNVCHLCHEGIDLALAGRQPEAFSIDHVLPRKQGGTNSLTNLRPAHLRCNSAKGAKLSAKGRKPTLDARFF